ncbi:hypothetical protein [Streptomyces sp. NPDC005303]|uniref:hypothetical protein n=1 Tax=Streptomyces sp. NPDC005303 TaxID=3155713 RepID=UPI0033A17B40
MTGLLAPPERNKTITCLAGAEPVTGAGMPGVQRLQCFLLAQGVTVHSFLAHPATTLSRW